MSADVTDNVTGGKTSTPLPPNTVTDMFPPGLLRALRPSRAWRVIISEFPYCQHWSSERGRLCAKCGESFAPDQPVVRQWRRWSRKDIACRGVVTIQTCIECAGELDRQVQKEHSCGVCGRMVITGSFNGVCSARCRWIQAKRRQRKQQQTPRPVMACTTCGGVISGGRSDSFYCSSACKQKAYRNRQRWKV